MTTLTERQQELIKSLKAEFSRINQESAKKGRFNLIDVNALDEKNAEIKRNREEQDADKKYWHELAMQEAERVAKLIQEDLPNAYAGRYGKENGRSDWPQVAIQREIGPAGHHENYVSFEVRVKTEPCRQSHNFQYNKGVGLEYVYKNQVYTNIERLFSNVIILDEIRTKILR